MRHGGCRRVREARGRQHRTRATTPWLPASASPFAPPTPLPPTQGLQAQGVLQQGAGEADGTQQWLANPALPDDILREAVPGNIRRAGVAQGMVWVDR